MHFRAEKEKKTVGRKFVFQQDNDPKHTSKFAKTISQPKKKQKELKYMEWPPQSLDLNSIELLWDELDKNVRKMQPTNQKQLWVFIQTCWN